MDQPTAISEPGQGGARPRRTWWRRAQWVAIPLLVFAAAEGLARAWVARVSGRTFLDRAERVARSGSIDFLFVGSSRVAASIDSGAFAEEIGKARGRQVHAVNMGTGYATLVEHDLALRELARAYPEAMKGCVVLIEAPGGIPDGLCDGRGRWDEPWSFEGEAIRLAPMLRPGDIPALWRSGFNLADKIHFTARDLGNSSILIAQREVLAESIADGLKARAYSLLIGKRPEVEKADLATGGGIQADPATVARNRGLARIDAARWLEDRRPIGPNWDDRVIGSIVRRVKAMEGGRVVFTGKCRSTRSRWRSCGLRYESPTARPSASKHEPGARRSSNSTNPSPTRHSPTSGTSRNPDPPGSPGGWQWNLSINNNV